MMQRREFSVLVVDDNASDRTLVSAVLKNLGFSKIQEAENGKVAEFKVNTSQDTNVPIHLILLDWNMPTMNGLHFLKFLKSRTAFRTTVVMIMTTDSQFENVQEAISAGAKDFMVKPVMPDTLERKLEPHFKFSDPKPGKA